MVHVAVNVSELERFAPGSEVDPEALAKVRLVQKRGARVKILGGGELNKKLTVSAHQFSRGAREKIVAAGGKIVELMQPDKQSRSGSPASTAE